MCAFSELVKSTRGVEDVSELWPRPSSSKQTLFGQQRRRRIMDVLEEVDEQPLGGRGVLASDEDVHLASLGVEEGETTRGPRAVEGQELERGRWTEGVVRYLESEKM